MIQLFTLPLLVSTALSVSLSTRDGSAVDHNATQRANLQFTSYSAGCDSGTNGNENVIYSKNYPMNVYISAYSLGRDLKPSEQFDFSNNDCTNFLYTVPNAQQAGCYTVTSSDLPDFSGLGS